MIALMLFLARRTDTPAAQAWWQDIRPHDGGAPSLIRELLRSPSVAADPIEAQQAVAWARAHPAWRDEDPPLIARDGVSGS
jgi:hypothetical protein